MGTITNITELINEHKKDGRKAWGKALVSAFVSAVMSVALTTWKVRGYIDELEGTLKSQTSDLAYLKLHLPEVEKTAIDARGRADQVERQLYAQLGGWPQNKVK